MSHKSRRVDKGTTCRIHRSHWWIRAPRFIPPAELDAGVRSSPQPAVLDGLAEYNENEVALVREAVEEWLEMNAWAKKLEHKNAALREITNKLENVTSHAMRVLPALDAHQHNLEIKAIWLKPMRMFILLTIILGTGRFLPALGVLLAIAAGTGIYLLKRKAGESQDELADRVDWLMFGAEDGGFHQALRQ